MAKEKIAAPGDELQCMAIPTLDWSSDELAKASLDTVRNELDKAVLETMSWYGKRKKSMKFFARGVRILAFGFFALGGLVPLVKLMWQDLPRAEWMWQDLPIELGYLFFGLASVCMMSNQIFGFSSGWMRYLKIYLELKQLYEVFQIDWNLEYGQGAGSKHCLTMLGKLNKLAEDVNKLVYEETLAWERQFIEHLDRLAKSIQAEVTQKSKS